MRNIFFVLISLNVLAAQVLNCIRTTQRKEIREMAPNEFSSFVAAIKTEVADGSLATLSNLHAPDQHWNTAHFNPRFLPWHRLYLAQMEQLLISKGASYIPYWDWVE